MGSEMCIRDSPSPPPKPPSLHAPMSAATLSSLRHLLTRRLGGASIQPLRCALIGHALIYQPITPSLLTHSFARRILATWEPLANAGTAACARQLPKLSTRQAVLALGIGTVSSLGFRSSADCELAPPALLGPTLPTPIAEAPTYAGQQPLPLLNRLLQRLFYLARALYLWCVFCPLLLSSPLAFWQTRFPTLEELWWRCCVKTLERTGALVIKLAQWASSRPDLFGERTCARVEHLQDRTPPHALRETEATLDAMFGTEWRQKLKIDPEPLGSGCIAQVRANRLLERGMGQLQCNGSARHDKCAAAIVIMCGFSPMSGSCPPFSDHAHHLNYRPPPRLVLRPPHRPNRFTKASSWSMAFGRRSL